MRGRPLLAAQPKAIKSPFSTVTFWSLAQRGCLPPAEGGSAAGRGGVLARANSPSQKLDWGRATAPRPQCPSPLHIWHSYGNNTSMTASIIIQSQ